MSNSLQNSANLLQLLYLAVEKQSIDQTLTNWKLDKNRYARYLLEHTIISHLLIAVDQLLADNTDRQQLLTLLSSKSLDSTQLAEWLAAHTAESAPTLRQVGARVLFSLSEPA
ncbi:MAG TPA: hypothetical protein PKX78_03510 [Candidatus Woesebacteria bacterium]|nr:hypothetical protein [Candidatus Woesebacteria bacterium]